MYVHDFFLKRNTQMKINLSKLLNISLCLATVLSGTGMAMAGEGGTKTSNKIEKRVNDSRSKVQSNNTNTDRPIIDIPKTRIQTDGIASTSESLRKVESKKLESPDHQVSSKDSNKKESREVHVDYYTQTNIRPLNVSTINQPDPLTSALNPVAKIGVTFEECEKTPWLTPAPEKLIAASYTDPEARKILLKRLYDGFITKAYQETIDIERLFEEPSTIFTSPLMLDVEFSAYITYAQLTLGGPNNLVERSAKFYLKGAQTSLFPHTKFLMATVLQEGKNLPKNILEAIKLLELASKEGYPHAEYRLGLAYMTNDLGVKTDYNKAVQLFESAAEKNYAPAQCSLGLMYKKSLGKSRDYDAAIRLIRLAANQKYGPALLALGDMYETGLGIQGGPAPNVAMELWKEAALQGSSDAQNNLAVIYIHGKSYYNKEIPKNLPEAVRLLNLAVEQGNDAAENNLGLLYEQGYGVPQNYEEAIKLYKLSSSKGNNDARVNLGLLYEYGNNEVRQDYDEAKQLYSLAAGLGHPIGQYKLGTFYMSGKGRPNYNDEMKDEMKLEDYKAAKEHFWHAAKEGNADAQFNLGKIYEQGLGVEKNIEEAIKWYSESALQNCAAAKNNLGVLYKNGNEHLPQDHVQAFNLFKSSVDQNYGPALINLADMYFYGLGVEQDLDEATRLINRAQDNPELDIKAKFKSLLLIAELI
jgi:TPR repeat protein